MKNKFNHRITALLGAIVASAAFFAGSFSAAPPAATAAEVKTLYTCGMHPQVIQDHPGNCPICGMKLTPVRKQPTRAHDRRADHHDPHAATSDQRIDPGHDAEHGLPHARWCTRGPLRRIIRTVGVVDFDETALADVTTKFKGWIEKLYVDATGQQVHRGEPLFEIYSPELYSAQTEYLLALEPGRQQAARRRFAQDQRADQTEVLRHLRRANRRTGEDASSAKKTLRDLRAARRLRGGEDGRRRPDGGRRA